MNRFLAGLSLLVVSLTLCAVVFMRMANTEALRTAREAADLVKSVLNVTPRVSITSHVSEQRTAEIMELATVTREFPIEYASEETFLGSTKRLALRGQFTVKAGFDLRESFELAVDSRTGIVRATFPAPRILSIQMNDYIVTRDEDGWWNKLTQKDQENLVKAMNRQARSSAEAGEILQAARDSLEKQLLELASKAGQQWEIRFGPAPRAEF